MLKPPPLVCASMCFVAFSRGCLVLIACIVDSREPGYHTWPYCLRWRCYHTMTPPSGGFPSSIARRPRGCPHRMLSIRLRKALDEMFPAPTFMAPTLLLILLWKYRPWKIGPGGCVAHCRIRYVGHTQVGRYPGTTPGCAGRTRVGTRVGTRLPHRVTVYLVTVKVSHPLGRFSEPIFSKRCLRRPHTANVMTLERWGRYCCPWSDASLVVCLALCLPLHCRDNQLLMLVLTIISLY